MRCVYATTLLTAATTAAPGFLDTGPGRFLISPGFGGAAALIGGLLAYLAARRQSTDARAKTIGESDAAKARADADAETSRAQRWWQTLTWIYDRATAEREDAQLTVTLTLRLLDRLARQAHTEVEYETVLGLIEAFTDERQAP